MRDLIENFKNWVNAVSSGSDLDMSPEGDFDYEVKDNQYRDIYARGHERHTSSKAIITIIPCLVIGVLSFLFFIMVPLFVGKVITHQGFFSGLFVMYLQPLHGWILLLLLFALLYVVHIVLKLGMTKYWQSQNAGADDRILDDFKDDARLRQPEELAREFDVFPDMGAHAKDTDVTALLSHVALTNDGINEVLVPLRADGEHDKDEADNLINKNVPYYDENDHLATHMVPFIDTEMAENLWSSAGIPEPLGKNRAYIAKRMRRRYRPDKLLYNPMHTYGKSEEETVAERINNDWYMPEYEVQRPSGMYVVDTEPNNTMVLAMTRAGKGQKVIEPTIDCWLRSKVKSNIVCNDPKGELYLKFYYIARKRGYKVIAFNLLKPTKTDIYNPLGYAVEAARQNNITKTEEYVKTIGDVFFPPDKSDDPMWPNAANAAFQRSALGLIDYYMEEDAQLRTKARIGSWSTSHLLRALDESWGHVTLYNVYQMMTQLAAKKSKDANFIHIDPDDPSDEKDYLTLFFDATAALPQNALRMSVANQDNSLRAMAGSEKTIASVYGISLTAIKFFADDRISRLTSGRPSQNLDIVGMSFPRRFEVKLDSKFVKDNALREQLYKWEVFKDPDFKEPLKVDADGKSFEYENTVSPDGWLNYVTDAIFPEDTVYLKLSFVEQVSGFSLYQWYFKFTKGYQINLDGRSYVIDPVSEKQVYKDGLLVELGEAKQSDGSLVYQEQMTMLDRERISLLEDQGQTEGSLGHTVKFKVPLFEQLQVHYSEEPTMAFFITPPHLLSYARIVLILINQMFNMQVDSSYLMLPSQKPFLKTKYMLDEVGNLQSDGSGIPFLQTKESIGLGQGQYFTLILQTLQQLQDVYGESIDKILEGNTGNIIYLKSTDDTMLETLEKLSGQKHVLNSDNQTVTKSSQKIMNSVDDKVSKSQAVKEVPVISKNDMLRTAKGDMMVFGHKDPIWSHNQLAMPFSFMSVHSNALNNFENPQKYNLSTVPTTSNTMDFDILNNQPNFIQMVSKRVTQARMAKTKRNLYKQYHQMNGKALGDDELAKINADDLARELMFSINEQLDFNQEVAGLKSDTEGVTDDDIDLNSDAAMTIESAEKVAVKTAESNQELEKEVQKSEAIDASRNEKRYAEHQISRMVLVEKPDDLNAALIGAFKRLQSEFINDSQFKISDDGSLLWNGELMIKSLNSELNDVSNAFNNTAASGSNDVFGGNSSFGSLLDAADDVASYEIQPAFYQKLSNLNDWDGLLNGKFDHEVGEIWRKQETDDSTSETDI